ncbi:MAG: hypothetical protein K0Q84_2830 [Arthrobacter sp.]|nr:hypothetical protein [Arthrobacter sp.]
MNGDGFRRRPGAAWLCGPLMVALGVAAHSAVGQPVPALSLLVALTALLSLAASVTARTGMPGWMLLLLAGLVQQVLHLAFSVFSGTGGGTGATGHGHGMLIWQPQQPPAVSAAPDHTLELLLYTHTAAALLAVLLIAKWDAVTRLAVTAGRTAGNNVPA